MQLSEKQNVYQCNLTAPGGFALPCVMHGPSHVSLAYLLEAAAQAGGGANSCHMKNCVIIKKKHIFKCI